MNWKQRYYDLRNAMGLNPGRGRNRDCGGRGRSDRPGRAQRAARPGRSSRPAGLPRTTRVPSGARVPQVRIPRASRPRLRLPSRGR